MNTQCRTQRRGTGARASAPGLGLPGRSGAELFLGPGDSGLLEGRWLGGPLSGSGRPGRRSQLEEGDFLFLIVVFA